MTKPFLLGVLGGMGPLATLDFQRRLLDATPAQNDRQQIPSVVWNVPDRGPTKGAGGKRAVAAAAAYPWY
jgi:aspartate/glutamate racemase